MNLEELGAANGETLDERDRLAVALAYLVPFALIAPTVVLVTVGARSRYARFHAAQALAICILPLLLSMGAAIAFYAAAFGCLVLGFFAKAGGRPIPDPSAGLGYVLVILQTTVALAAVASLIAGGIQVLRRRPYAVPVVAWIARGVVRILGPEPRE